jgi:predicted DNA-binding protein (UPF0251 family)
MSPRKKKPRTCGCKIKGGAYKPAGIPVKDLDKIEIFIDELEALRLCDSLSRTQEEAGREMGISRGTVQRILSSARKKVADALSGCKAIILEDNICDNTTKPDDITLRRNN